ncbi:RB3GP-like protein [Mya arenaria]|uniref:Rab3 GTPase-activating protein catalytic subunit n=1 Tax=Mya arenaria TaxID=6604 RepID=A0ABY7EHY7_MYAAR|nr:RB3GP-like protein [Mya arenaria]
MYFEACSERAVSDSNSGVGDLYPFQSPHLSERSRDLDPLQAPLWSVRVQMTEDPQCLLGEYLSQFLALCHRQETLEQLLGGLGQEMRQSDSTGDISTALQRLTEPQLSYNMPSLSSYVAHPPKQGAVKPTLTPIEGDMLTQILQCLYNNSLVILAIGQMRQELPRQLKSAPVESCHFAFYLCVLNHNGGGGILAVTQMWQEELPRQLKSAPVESLLYRFAITLCVLNHNNGGILAVAQMWQEFSRAGTTKPGFLHPSAEVTACAIEEEVTGNDACDKNNQSYSKNRNGVKNRNKGSAIRTNEKRDSQRLASSGESSDDEFFECNDDEANQSDEKDVDTTSENRNKSQGTTSEQTTEGEEMEDNENQTENEIDCQDEDQTGLEGDENREASSENPDLTGSQTTQDTNSLSNVSVVSDTQYKESYSHSPEGRLATFQDLRLINCDDRMYIPVTQEPAPMTEDMLEEHAEVLAKLGTSAEGAELRARMQSVALLVIFKTVRRRGSVDANTKFTSELLEHRDATTELQVFVRSVLQNSEVTIRGGPMGPAGSVITKLFQSAMRASYMILDDDDTGTTQPSLAEEDSTHNSSVPNFPRPLAREYILRTILPRPAPYSRTLPQRMYCCIEEDEFRLAGAFTVFGYLESPQHVLVWRP